MMSWLRDNADLIAIVTLALALTAKAPFERVHTDAYGHEAGVRAEIDRAVAEARGEIRRTLRATTALHRYNDSIR
ncbi:MAG TPA: hypothetical protein VFL57_02190 [Bryobacteraceae bacterium]|nr:hypothetical protein [Bryobacteraceae bacterium]